MTMSLKMRTATTIFTLLTLLIIMITDLSIASDMGDCGAPSENLTCQWQDLCKPYFNHCRCDDACELYNDCCPDFTPSVSLKDRYDPSVISCKEEQTIAMMEKIFVINACPKWFSDDIRRNLCEQTSTASGMLAKLPVSDKNGILFGNVHCALCNGVKHEDVVYWKADISCDIVVQMHNMTALQEQLKKGKCLMSYKQPSHEFIARKCFDLVDSCPPDYANECVRHNCENSTFFRPVFGVYGKTFKNEHCAKCSLDEPVETYPKFSCDSNLLNGVMDNLYPMSIIIDLNTAGGGKVGYKEYGRTINETETQPCETGFMMDYLQNECVLISCAPGLTQIGHECVAASEDIRDCVRRVLSPVEYNILENGTMVDKFGRTYNKSQYEDFGNGTMAVCINIPKVDGVKYVYKFDKAQTIFSVVGQCISIVCLIVHLAVYSILPQLRNSPGKSLMALVASLLAAQILFLVGVGQTEPYGLCVTIGVFIHYSFLASFFWMGVMSFDIWATFSDTASSFAHRSNKFSKYCLTGFGVPLVIVTIPLILNFIGSVPDYIKPGYGEGWCWLVNKTSLIVFFGTPVFSIVFINILLYCLTLRALYQISQATKQVQTDKSERRRFALYVKLSSIMGLTWFFGLIAVLADISALWYIFLFFNTLQGAFICIAFIFTKKVISLLKDKFKKTWPHSETADTLGTGSTNLSKRHASSSSPPINIKSQKQSPRPTSRI